jgi:hypothetical protein
MTPFAQFITASLLAGGAAFAVPAVAADPAGIEAYAGLEFAQRGDNRRQRRLERMQNSTRTSSEARVFTSRRAAGASVITRGEARASGDAFSVSEADVFSRTDSEGSEADGFGRSEAEALQRVPPPE